MGNLFARADDPKFQETGKRSLPMAPNALLSNSMRLSCSDIGSWPGRQSFLAPADLDLHALM